MTDRLHRRDALRLGLAGLAGGSLWAVGGPRGHAQQTHHEETPVPTDTVTKMLLIFLRGGADLLNGAVPIGPAALAPSTIYSTYQGLRPDIYIHASGDTSSLLALHERGQPLVNYLGATHPLCELHPAMASLLPIYAAGDIAVLHRIGYEQQSLSHFTSQQYWETAKPGDYLYLKGWVTRWAATQPSGFLTASVSGNPQQLFATDTPSQVQPHILRLTRSAAASPYAFEAIPGSPTGSETYLRAGIDAASQYGAGDPPLLSGWDELARATGQQTVFSATEIETAALAQNPYVPSAGVYPLSNPSATTVPTDLPTGNNVTAFGNNLKKAVALLKHTSARVVGVELTGGWDTHLDQGGAYGTQQGLLATLAAGLRAVWDDFNADPPPTPDLLTLVMTEFGRTTEQNDSQGTDHAYGNAMFAMGNRVRRATQVYNCSTAPTEHDPWTGATFTDFGSGKYMSHQTDFRAVFEEAVVKHLHYTGNTDQIFPNLAAVKAATTDPYHFTWLNYLRP